MAKADTGKQRFLGIAKKKQGEFNAALATRDSDATKLKAHLAQAKEAAASAEARAASAEKASVTASAAITAACEEDARELQEGLLAELDDARSEADAKERLLVEARKITSSQEQTLLRLQGELEEGAAAHVVSLDRFQSDAANELRALRGRCAEAESDAEAARTAGESERIAAELSARAGNSLNPQKSKTLIPNP